MTSLLSTLRQNDARRFFAWAVLLAYLFQAIIPLGYMPDIGALQKGVFKITICTMDGARSILADKDGQPSRGDNQNKKRADAFCPFGAMPKIALGVFAPEILIAFFIYVESKIRVQQFSLARISYSATQPRAPPVF